MKTTTAIALSLTLASVSLAADDIKINANVKGKVKQIGTLSVTTGKDAKADDLFGKFTFADKKTGETLDKKYDFRWVNVLTGVVEKGKPVDEHFLVGKVPAIDPAPSDGPEPFYYNAGEWKAETFHGYDIRTEGEHSMFYDAPNTGRYDSFTFQNFLVVSNVADPAWKDDKHFCVLAGYEWTYAKGTKVVGDDYTDDVSKFSKEIAVTKDVVANINKAIGNAKLGGDFKGWSAGFGCELCKEVPAPGSLFLLGMSSLIAARRRRAA